MDIKKTKILLEKINSLYKSIRLEDGPLASIERDLMLSYLRQLYEQFQEQGHSSAKPAEQSIPEPVVRQSGPEPEPEPEVRATPDEPSPAKRPYNPPRIIEIPDSIKELTAQVAESRARNRNQDPYKPKTDPLPKPRVKPTVRESPSYSTSNSEKPLENLLGSPRSNDLSERLSQSPIRDLSKAMAINDRLLFVNELFGKDMRSLESALSLLNGYNSFDEAKSLLAELAHDHNWNDEARAETARDFLKLVQRRYL